MVRKRTVLWQGDHCVTQETCRDPVPKKKVRARLPQGRKAEFSARRPAQQPREVVSQGSILPQRSTWRAAAMLGPPAESQAEFACLWLEAGQ